MTVTRRAVLEQLATVTDAEHEETTTAERIASALDTDEQTIETHLDGLAACDLARVHTDGRVRVTITGEELLELDTDDVVIVDASEVPGER
jgi:predicted ArsR family transcriptional regulator